MRKALLIAESELNRAQLVEDWVAMSAGVRTFGERVKTVGTIASATALLVAAASAYGQARRSSRMGKVSWLATALKGAQMAGSLWVAMRGHRSNNAPDDR